MRTALSGPDFHLVSPYRYKRTSAGKALRMDDQGVSLLSSFRVSQVFTLQ